MIRYILDYDSCEYLYFKDFSKTGYLSVEKRHDYPFVNMIYSIYYGFVLSYLRNFARIEDVHTYDTRHSAIAVHFYRKLQDRGRKFLCTVGLDYGMDCQLV